MTAEEFKNKILPFSRKLFPMLFRMLKDQEETRDAFQDLMVKLWTKRKELENCTNLDSYIYTVAKNYSIDLLKKKRPTIIGENDAFKILNIENSAEPETREKYEYVHRSIENLPGKIKR